MSLSKLGKLRKNPRINLGKLLALIPDLENQVLFLQVKINTLSFAKYSRDYGVPSKWGKKVKKMASFGFVHHLRWSTQATWSNKYL